MSEVNSDTIKRELLIKALGYSVTAIWEHDYKKRLKKEPAFSMFVNDFKLPNPLFPREAFFGGRTNAMKLHHRVSGLEKIRYFDVTSE